MNKDSIVITNRQALRDYYIDKVYEAGVALKGNEIKSLREAKANLKGSFAKIEKDGPYLYNMHISPYKYSREEYNPLRPRKLLLHKAELRHLNQKTVQRGYTLVPMKVYFRRGYAKIEIALARGKKLYDKRRAIKERQAKKEIDEIKKR